MLYPRIAESQLSDQDEIIGVVNPSLDSSRAAAEALRKVTELISKMPF